MKDKDLLARLPYHAEYIPDFQLKRLRKQRRILAVFTNGENGVNLYPGPVRQDQPQEPKRA
jgi:hypothetical protein